MWAVGGGPGVNEFGPEGKSKKQTNKVAALAPLLLIEMDESNWYIWLLFNYLFEFLFFFYVFILFFPFFFNLIWRLLFGSRGEPWLWFHGCTHNLFVTHCFYILLWGNLLWRRLLCNSQARIAAWRLAGLFFRPIQISGGWLTNHECVLCGICLPTFLCVFLATSIDRIKFRDEI